MTSIFRQRSLYAALNLVFVVLAASFASARVSAQAPVPALPYLAGEVIAFIPGPGKKMLTKVAKRFNLSSKPIDEFGNTQIYRLRILDGMAPPDKAAQLLSDPRVKLAEPNYIGGFPEDSGKGRWRTGESSSAPASSWGLDKIHLSAAPSRGSGITVAVLDTGVDLSQPGLRGRLVASYDFVDNDRIPAERRGKKADAYGHGTHVAGIVAMVAPDAKIMPLRILDPEGVGNMWVLGKALRYAVDPNGDGNPADGAKVINLSLVSPLPSQAIDSILNDSVVCFDDDDNPTTPDVCQPRKGIRGKGVIIVAAAGNDDDGDPNTPAPVVYPAAQNGVVGVAASDPSDKKASFSNASADYVDISAPGVGITSLAPNNKYATWDGTSMAAPFVAAAAATIWSAQPALVNSEVIDSLRAKAEPIDAYNPGYAGQLGVGRLDFRPDVLAYVPIQLTSICMIDAAQGRALWRVRNSNPYPVTYIWQLYGSDQQAQRTVAASSDDLFEAPAGTLIVKANGQQSAKATNPASCAPPASPTATSTATPTATPTVTPTETPTNSAA